MLKYILKRVLITIPIMLCVVVIIFTILYFTPGDPGSQILGASASEEAVAELNHSLGYDRGYFYRLFSYIGDIITKFDFGISYTTQKPVVDEIMAHFPATFNLAAISVLLSTLIGVSLGVISAVKQYSVLDTTCTVTSMLLCAIPYFWLGLMLMLLFSVKLHLLPTSGIQTWTGYILPVAVCVLGGVGGMQRMTRSAMLETIRSDYIRTARAKGAGEKRVVWKHALKNALLPVITVSGQNFGYLLGGAVVIEQVFSLPGLGTYILQAIRQKNVPVVLSGTLFLAFLFCMIMLLVDVAYAFVDPRIKARYAK